MTLRTLSLPDFIARWRASTRTERSASQEHFLDLCDVLGQPHPAEVDPAGHTYTFEKGAAKVGGGDGFADVWMRGHFAWEYKGKHRNLEAAYQQLLQYREDLENPPLLVVCDFDRFEVHTNFTDTVKRVYRFSLADLASTEPTLGSALPPIEVLRALFTEPARLRPDRTAAQVTEKAAAEFALLAESLRKRGADPEQAARFLMRILFCLFAEDTRLLPQGLFTQLVDRTRNRPDQFNALVRQLFATMATGGWFGVEEVAYFNGGLFSDDTALDLTSDDLTVLGRAGNLDWASVEPAIFGTLFERSLDPSKRSQLGAHYTSRDDILLIVEPVLMEPLRRRWVEVQQQAESIITRRNASPDRATRTRLNNDLAKLLADFTDELHGVRVLDPACGSGNFLYVALKRLLDLEKEVSVFAATNGLPGMFPKVDPSQMYGIEINVYAHELASVVVWIGYIQWLRDNGFGVPTAPILKPLRNIRHMDAILAYDEQGRPVEPEWPKADVIIGNPPFVGGNKIRQELGDGYVDNLFRLFRGRLPAFADLVCYWHERARQMVQDEEVGRVGLLATNSIRQGANRVVLDRVKDTGDIFMAWSDRPWVLDGAAVRVSVIGFDRGNELSKFLNGVPVQVINSDLTATVDVSQAIELSENEDLCFYGSQQKGSFNITTQKALELLAAPSSFGKDSAKVVKKALNSMQLLRRTEENWVIDFGLDMPLEEASLYEGPFEYVKEVVLPERQNRSEKRQREYWWLHARPSPGYREILRSQRRYIATPSTSKHRIFVWLTPDTLANHALLVFSREDDYFFGVLHSRLHELWSLRTGSWIGVGNDPCYTPSTTFETYPFPWPPGNEPKDDPRVQAIAEAARELVEKRDAWLNPPDAIEAELKKRTLTNLYNQRPSWLDLAHKKLDRAVFDAYGWPHDLTDEQILERLLALNLERAARQGHSPTPVSSEESESD
jgi:type II restriction/modification system DNA methylase subunit YeeA